MIILEVVCDKPAPNPDGVQHSVGFAQRFSVANGYAFREVAAGIIVTKKRSVLIPWTNIVGCPVTVSDDLESGRALKGSRGKAGEAA